MSRSEHNRAARHEFALRWQGFIKAEFACASHASEAFGVRLQTAVNWFEGANSPEGHIVAAAFEMSPNMARIHLTRDRQGRHTNAGAE